MEEEQGIYREEVVLMMGALADITINTQRILTILEEDDDDEGEEEADS